MHALSAYFVLAIKHRLAYRVANWAGLFTNTFFLIFRATALAAAVGSSATGLVAHHDVMSIMGYATVSQALLMICPQWGLSGLGERIQSGEITSDLLRPVNFVWLHLSRKLGESAYYVVMRSIPILLLGWALGYLAAPQSWWVLVPFTISVVLGALIAHGIILFMGCTAFWLESEMGPYRIVLGLTALLSGLILPVAFFPEWLQSISAWLPFQYTLYAPTEIGLGQLQGAALWDMLLAQGCWAVVMLVMCQLAFLAGSRRLVSNGG